MADRTRTGPPPGPIPVCEYCGERFVPHRKAQRFCCSIHRARAHREKILEGTPARLAAGPRRIKDGWSVTLHLADLPAWERGEELRVKRVVEPGATELLHRIGGRRE